MSLQPNSSGLALPHDGSDVAATAQQLLKAHNQSLDQSTSNLTQHPPHQQWNRIKQRIANLDRLCQQLDNLTVSHSTKTSTSSDVLLHSFGPLAFFPAKVSNTRNVFLSQESQHQDSLATQLPILIPMKEGEETIHVDAVKSSLGNRSTLTFQSHSIQDAIKQLNSTKAQLQLKEEELRTSLISDTNDSVRQKLQQALSGIEGIDSNSTQGVVVNHDNQVLNEEGLPFYEPIEHLPDSPTLNPSDTAPLSDNSLSSQQNVTLPPRRTLGILQPLARSGSDQNRSQEQRKKWMDRLFDQLEQEEEQEKSTDEEEGDDSEYNADHIPGTKRQNTSKAVQAKNKKENVQAKEEAIAPVFYPEPLSPSSENRVVLRVPTPSPTSSPETQSTRLPKIVSAARPPPGKSVLKQPITDLQANLQRPLFGSTGIQRGFLNLNPSSPAAIKSSCSVEELEREQQQQQQQQRNNTVKHNTLVIPETRTVASSSADTSGTCTPTKKLVRIQSPERCATDSQKDQGTLSALKKALQETTKVQEKNYEALSMQAAPSTSSNRVSRHADDVGVEKAAARIVDLLGPGIVEGHPNAPCKEVLDQLQSEFEQDKRRQTGDGMEEQLRLERQQEQREKQNRLDEKPALGQTVLERKPATNANATKEVQKAKQNAFKRGFLNQKPPTNFIPVKPARKSKVDLPPLTSSSTVSEANAGKKVSPTQSLGMSAFERAALGDDEISKRRQEMGLSAAVPHARPSKAYREKLERQQQRADAPSDSQTLNVEKQAQAFRYQQLNQDALEQPRAGRVRFTDAPIVASSDSEHEMDEINPSAEFENYQDGEQEEDKARYQATRIRRGDSGSEDSDQGHPEGNQSNGRDHDDDDTWDFDDNDDDDDDDDDDEGYDTEDLMDLAPDMDLDFDRDFENAELMREYARAKAGLKKMGLAMGSSSRSQSATETEEIGNRLETLGVNQDDDEWENDIVPLDATLSDAEYETNTKTSDKGSKLSRFKASLGVKKASDTVSSIVTTAADDTEEGNNDFKALLANAYNVGPTGLATDSDAFRMDGYNVVDTDEQKTQGPVMIIPQLAPIHFPKDGDLVEGKRMAGPVELTGDDTDEEDERAAMVMHSRIERLEWKQQNPEQVSQWKHQAEIERQVKEGVAPPPIPHRKGKENVDAIAISTAPATTSSKHIPSRIASDAETPASAPPKKVSRFKASRME